MFKVIVHKRAAHELETLSKLNRQQILNELEEMRVDPFSGDVKPLKPLKGLFRKRIGDCRIIFAVNFQEEEVVVFKIGRRESVYEGI
jgi:mRNA-degrading endonuclease RelE of RelBE toxin-antitoxin system